MIHQLKTQHKFFEDVASGQKRFEVRYNDRNFKVGDFLALNEINDHKTKSNEETGRCVLVEVIYILKDKSYCKEDFVVLGITPCLISRTDSEMAYCNRMDGRLKCVIYGGDNNEDVRSRATEACRTQSTAEN